MPETVEVSQNMISTPWQLAQKKNGYYCVKYKKNDTDWELSPDILRFCQDTENVYFFTYAARKNVWSEWVCPKKKAFSHAALNGLNGTLGNIQLPKGVTLPGNIEARLTQA